MTNEPGQPTLRRRLSLPMIVLYGLGTTIGGGIYVLVGTVAGRAGLYAPLSFVVAALMVAFTAFSFAELSSRFPKSAGEAVFIKEGLNIPALAIIVGYLVVFNGIVSSAALTEGFVGYFQSLIPVPKWAAVVGVITLIGLLACWGIGESVMIASVVTVIEIGGLVLILWVCRASFLEPVAIAETLLPPFDPSVWAGIMAGSFLAFYAFIGFEDMVNVAEEVKNPERTLPLAIILTLSLTTLIYLLVVVAVILSVPLEELAASNTPLMLVYESRTGQSGKIVSLISILAVLNGALIQIIMASRVLYGMAVQGWCHQWCQYIHPLTRTPVFATLAIVSFTVMLALTFEIDILAQTVSFIILLIATLANLSLYRIKQRDTEKREGLDLPRWAPLTGFAISATFGFFLFIDLTRSIVSGF